MLIEILIAAGLVVTTVAMHAAGFAMMIRMLIARQALGTSGFCSVTRVVIAITCWLIFLHLAEIAIWGIFYFWSGCLPDVEVAFYFSGVTYTTVGYGDIVLPKPWRMFAMLEAVTGILMCGLSTGLFFALVNQWINKFIERKTHFKNSSETLL